MRPITQVETPAPVVVAPPELAPPEPVARREEIEEPMEEGEAGNERLEIATEATTQVRIYIHISLLLLSVFSTYYVTSVSVRRIHVLTLTYNHCRAKYLKMNPEPQVFPRQRQRNQWRRIALSLQKTSRMKRWRIVEANLRYKQTILNKT